MSDSVLALRTLEEGCNARSDVSDVLQQATTRGTGLLEDGVEDDADILNDASECPERRDGCIPDATDLSTLDGLSDKLSRLRCGNGKPLRHLRELVCSPAN